MLTRILAGVVLSLMLTGAAAAGPFEEAWDADQRGNYATALRLMRPLAEQGKQGREIWTRPAIILCYQT